MSAAIGAVGSSYYALAKLFNRTIIKAGRERLYVRQTPLPWFGVLDLPISGVQNLYAAYHVIRRSRRGVYGVNITYGVRAVLKDGWRREIVGKLREADDALYLQQKLEQHLGIASQAVPDELPLRGTTQTAFGHGGQRPSSQPADSLFEAQRQAQSQPETGVEHKWGGLMGTMLFLTALLVPLGALGWFISATQEPLTAFIYGLVALIVVGAVMWFVLSKWEGEIIDMHGIGMGQRYTHIRQPNGKRKKIEYSSPKWQLGSRLEKRRGEFIVRHYPRR